MQKNFLIIEDNSLLKDIIVENVTKYFKSKIKINFHNLDYLDDIRNYENIDLSIINFSYIKLNHKSFSNVKKNANNNFILIFDDGGERYQNKNYFDYKFVIKPFKLQKLFNIISNIFITHEVREKYLYLAPFLIFKPDTKVILNKKNNRFVSLTEKEGKLLNYLYSNKAKVLKKHDILINVWGINESVNTHTLETHVYSLKKKLDKLNLDLNFKLSDQSGGYFFHKF